MELTVVERGVLDSEAVNALYGLHSEARYAMLSNRDQPTLLELLEFDVPGSSIRIGRPSWDYGYYDVAFRAKDNAAEHEHFTAMGLNYYCPPTRYVADWINLDVLEAVLCGPDSMPMALIERLKEPIPKFDGRFSILYRCGAKLWKTARKPTGSMRTYLGSKRFFDETLPDGLVDANCQRSPRNAHKNADVLGRRHAHIRMPGVFAQGQERVRLSQAGKLRNLLHRLREARPRRRTGRCTARRV